MRQFREGLFRPRGAAAGGCCGSEVVTGEAPIVEGAAPAAVIAPGGPPVGAPVKSEPAILDPAGPTNGSSSAKPANGRTSYGISQPRANTDPAVSQSLDSNPEPATRSAQGSAPSKNDSLDNLSLENLPPFDVALPPQEQADSRSPSAPAAAASARPPATPPGPANASTDTANKAKASASPLPPAADAAPGLRRFVSTEPKLAGGSLPNAAGLDWLAEKGYKTLLDLREITDVQPSFIAEVTNRGLRYVALPISVKTLDADHVSRFQAEISLADGRPLYFCDTDGSRAGALWYIRRVAIDKVDVQSAQREAIAIGLTDDAFQTAAMAYVERHKPAKSADLSEPRNVAPTAIIGDIAPAATEETVPDAVSASPKAPAVTAPENSELQPTQPRITNVSDPTAWRSFAALFITGLTAPLAYMGRSVLPSIRIRKRASLQAPARRPKSLPASSGE
jgi:protein tyrosine phosphatase (PTP) superfamily phosphohydrolase (DUF442 family)